jgi:phospholipase/carboxylesterase
MNKRLTLGALFGVVAVAAAFALRSPQAQSRDGTLSFKAHAPVNAIVHGMAPLGLAKERDGFLFVPKANDSSHRAPLLILLHGATQRARLFERLIPLADTLGVVVLAPDSREMTWDAIRGEFGPDVAFLDRAIMLAFDRAFIDPCRVVIGGFSDGASYALSLGIRNPRVLRGVVALSPGFVIPGKQIGRLPVFIRHGTKDQILPIERTSRPLLAALKDAGFTVDYEEFDGPHAVRPADTRTSMQWTNERACER